MRPLNLSTLIEFEPLWPRVVFNTTVKSVGEEVSFWIEHEGDDAVKRYLGCVIISAMPEDGVNEALQSLLDIFAFNTQRLQLPPSQEIVEYRAQGKVVGKSARPDLQIEG